MRRKKHRLSVARLFILGAGASHSASSARGGNVERQTPLDKDFCQRIENLNCARPLWVETSKQYVIQEWKDHIPFKSLGLEQAVFRQLTNLEFIDAIHPRRRTSAVTDIKYLNHLSHLICFLLRKGRETQAQQYATFVDKVFPSSISFDVIRDRVITFNYDELLDKHLLERFTLAEVYFDRLKESSSQADKRTQKIDNPLLIKLHGSVNWRCSTKDVESIVRNVSSKPEDYFIKSIWHSSVGTPSPDDDSSPLIMPPLPVKPITRVSLFRYLWTKAYEYLHEADELIICGYSLPEADRLAQSMFASFHNRSLKQITVIDPNPNILGKWKDLFRRGTINRNAKWTYYENFSEYIAAL